MTNDRIEQAAKIIGSIMSQWDLDGRPNIPGGIDVYIAKSLLIAGYLAHEEEWAPGFSDGDAAICCGYGSLNELRDHCPDPSGIIVHRYVTEWKEVN